MVLKKLIDANYSPDSEEYKRLEIPYELFVDDKTFSFVHYPNKLDRCNLLECPFIIQLVSFKKNDVGNRIVVFNVSEITKKYSNKKGIIPFFYFCFVI